MLNVETVKVMPAGPPQNTSNENAIIDDSLLNAQNNEIVPNDPESLLRLLQPPSQDFTPEESEAREAGGPSIMEILSRKETFSWALTDAATEEEKGL